MAVRRTENGNVLLRVIPEVISRFDRQLRILSVSASIEKLTGLPPRHFVGRKLDEIGLQSRSLIRLRETLEKAFESDEEARDDFTFELSSGKILRLSATVIPEIGGDEQVEFVNCVLRDVTAQKATSVEIEAVKPLQLQLVINAIPGLISYVDRDLRYVFANRGYTEWFGISPSEMCGKEMIEVIGAAGMGTVGPYLDRAFAGEAVTFEESVVYKGGKKRDVRGNYFPDIVDGVVAGVVVHLTDITEEKRMQNAALHLAAIVADSDDAIISKDLNGNITSWNSAAEKLFGYSAAEAVGKPIAMLAVPDRANEMPIVLNKIRGGDRVDHYETVRRTKDGRPIAVSLTVSPIRDFSGKIIGASKIVRDVSERKRIQLALQAREEESRHLLASLPDVIWRFDRNHRFLYASPAVEGKTGMTPEFYVGKTQAEAGIPAEVSSALEAKLDEILETGLPGGIEFELDSPDRTVRSYYGLGVPELGPDKRVSTVLTIVRDITEQKRAEEGQIALERELLLLIEASGTLLASPDSADVSRKIVELAQQFVSADAYALWRMQTGTETWHMSSWSGLSNQFVERSLVPSSAGSLESSEPVMVGDIRRSELLAARFHDLQEEGVASMLIIPLRIFGDLSSTVVFYWRTRHEFSDAEVRLSTALGNLAASALGTAELYEREIKLRAVAETSQRSSAFLAEVGAVLSSSLNYQETLARVAKLAVPAFADWCSVYILDEERHIKQISVEHADPEKIELAYELTRKYPPAESDSTQVALRTGASVLVEDLADQTIERQARDPEHARLIRKLGIRSFIIVPMRMGDRVLGIITFAVGESNRRYSEQDLRTAEEVARRAATSIENARLYEESRRRGQALRRSNAELRRANSDLEQFAYSASHDLKEPLRMVSLFTQLLERKYAGKLDEQALDYISHAVQGAQRMELLMRDLLAYTTASSAADQPIETADASEILAQTLDTLGPALHESGAKIFHSELPNVRMQAGQLQQLFQNLIGNAIKYRSTASPQIQITAEPDDDQWLFSVKDNGIGISTEYFEQIFGLFKRLHGKDEYEGTGLGLAICKKIVESAGGRIWVESELGNGSTFHFTLPRSS